MDKDTLTELKCKNIFEDAKKTIYEDKSNYIRTEEYKIKLIYYNKSKFPMVLILYCLCIFAFHHMSFFC